MLGTGAVLSEAGTTLTLTGMLTGNGSFAKKGQGTMVIAGDATGFTGTTSIQGGTLSVDASLCGEVNVLDGGRLEGTGTVCDTNNFAGGTIAPGNSIGTLTVAGDYAGSGGTLEIEAVLGADASLTDRLVVTGDTSGTSNIEVVNLNGSGAQTVEGIKIVDVGGASDGTFSLLGDYVFDGDQAVVGGAYAYRLYQGSVSAPNDGDWYLRSNLIDEPDSGPLYSPAVPLYEAYAGVLQTFNEVGTLRQRVGNRAWGPGAPSQGMDPVGADAVDGNAIWGLIEATHALVDPQNSTTDTDYEATTWKLHAGIDGVLHQGDEGVLVGGVTVHTGTVSSAVSSIFGAGTIDATGHGVGGTLTWYADNGLYVDAVAQATWFDSTLRSATLDTTLVDGNNAFGYVLSLEAGQKIALDEHWSITPQAQLAYSSVDFDHFTDRYGAAVSLDDGDTLVGRIGLSIDYEEQWRDEVGRVSRSHLYGIANIYYDALDGSTTNVSGTRFSGDADALGGGIGLGASLDWDDGRYSMFGEASARGSFEDLGDSYSLGARLGLNIKW